MSPSDTGAVAQPVLPPEEVRKLPRQRWSFVDPHPVEAAALAHAARLPQVLAELLVARGIADSSAAFAFLHETTTEWYERFQALLEDVESFEDIVIDDKHTREDEDE